jgi:hypothetical protein
MTGALQGYTPAPADRMHPLSHSDRVLIRVRPAVEPARSKNRVAQMGSLPD